MFEGIKKAVKKMRGEKPKPKTLGSGMAKKAAEGMGKHNAETQQMAKQLDQYRKGGKVRKTGPALVHKDEEIITAKQAKKPAIKKALKKVRKRG